jgi:hypothetical protein
VPPEVPTLTPQLCARQPDLVSDGGGLPFEPALGFAAFKALEPGDAPVQALLGQIDIGLKRTHKRGLFRRAPRPEPLDIDQKLAGWRALAVTEDEVLYAKGRPPQLLTVAVRRRRRDTWTVVGVSNSRPLRAVRDGVRASSWRLDPEFEPGPDATELRVLVTEQTVATGRPAEDRMLTPDLHLGDSEAVLRMYVRPLEGYTGRTRKHETAVTVQLPEQLGERTVIDGALYEALS